MNFSGVGQESVSEGQVQDFNLSLDTDHLKNWVGDNVFASELAN